jgi:hypothetical protein
MYVPTLILVVLAVWWFIVRPAKVAGRERQEQLQRERDRLRDGQKHKEALAELETFHWQKQMLSGDMLMSIDVHFPTMRMRMETASRFGGDESTS